MKFLKYKNFFDNRVTDWQWAIIGPDEAVADFGREQDSRYKAVPGYKGTSVEEFLQDSDEVQKWLRERLDFLNEQGREIRNEAKIIESYIIRRKYGNRTS